MTAADVLTIAKQALACERGLGYFDKFKEHTRKELAQSSAEAFWLWLATYDVPESDGLRHEKVVAYCSDMRWCLSNMLVWRGMREGEITQLLHDILDTKRNRYSVWAGDNCVVAVWGMDIAEARAICRALARAYSE